MQKKLFFIVFLLSLTLSSTGNVWATIECCCEPLSCTFVQWLGKETKDVPVNDCYYFTDDQSWMCEERLICISEIEAELGGLWYLIYKPGEIIVDGICDISLSDDACESEELLGADHPGLDVLRKFRDEVLAKSEKGKRLTKAYYEHRSELNKVFEENPGIAVFATALLEKTIELIEDNLYNEDELSADAVADDIEVLAEELDMIVENPGLKKILNQIKQDVNDRTLVK